MTSSPRESKDALLERLAVVRLAHADDLHLTIGGAAVLLGELLTDLDGAIFRTVLGEDDLVGPSERLQSLAHVDDGGVKDGLFVVDGDDDRNARRVVHR
jgi:hypothetical protein